MRASVAFDPDRERSQQATAPPEAERSGAGTPVRHPKGTGGRLRPSQVPVRSPQGVLRGAGQPLASPQREEMENLLGADFSTVRVHTDSAARASADEFGARAYTAGDHVVVGDGGADKQTLAHELTHVIQQRVGPVAGTDHGSGVRLSDPSDPFERAAESAAVQAVRGSGSGRQTVRRGRPIPSRALHGFSSLAIQRTRGKYGRRWDLAEGSPNVIKVVIAGSGDDEWKTNTVKEPAADKRSAKGYKKKGSKEETSVLTAHEEGADLSSDKDTDPRKDKIPKKIKHLTYAGPGAKTTTGFASLFHGVIDSGSNSIEKLVTKVPPQVIAAAEAEYNSVGVWPTILVKAHSRGAVAASRVVKKLQDSLAHCKIELVLYDPVPGPGHKGEDTEVTLPVLQDLTLVYSLASGYRFGFDPQSVLGAKRIIVSAQNHTAGIRQGFRYIGEDGVERTYTGSRLNSLPAGVFVDLNKTAEGEIPLQKVRTMEEFSETVAEVSGPAKGASKGRQGTIDKILATYFEEEKSKSEPSYAPLG